LHLRAGGVPNACTIARDRTDSLPRVSETTGLSEAEAQRRLAERGPQPSTSTSRSYRSIVVANTLTVFNAILAAFGVLTVLFGDPKDALFVGILVANVTIGIFQEVRAKRALDSLAAVVAPVATVVRDGTPREVPVGEVLEGDLVRVKAGDQIVADGELVTADGLALDESDLTGESDAIRAAAGREVFSGTFVVEGDGAFRATAVGPDSRAARLTETARAFRHPRSPLERAMDRLLIVFVAVMLPLGVALGVSLALRDVSQADAVETLTAAVVNIVPEGLILLVSLTMAVSAAKMARRGVLAQQLNAIESLASVSVLCTDKTGTLTEAALRVVAIVPADGFDEATVARDLGRYAAASTARNSTLEAVHAAGLGAGGAAERPTAAVPFSSRRRWSALELDGDRFVLGAPEALLDGAGGAAVGGAGGEAASEAAAGEGSGGGTAVGGGGTLGDGAAAGAGLAARAAQEAAAGRRVLAIVAAGEPLPPAAPDAPLPGDLRPLGLVVLAERLRQDADRTVAFFAAEDVTLKVLSGDNPATVGAIARDAGITGTDGALDGRSLPPDDADLLRSLRAVPAIGRISPEGKERVIRVLTQDGEYVGMVGDGVNDVPALKQARVAIAQGSGTQMARSVSDLVLVSGDFAQVPQLVHEGRQILRNIQRVARLFAVKALMTAFLLVTVALPTGIFPLLPRQFTLASTLALGIPSFFLALAPSTGPWRPEGFLAAIARFSIPAGLAAGAGVLAGYLLARYGLDCTLAQARTVTVTLVVTAGLVVVIVLEDEPGRRRLGIAALCALMALAYVIVCALPFGRDFFDLSTPTGSMALAWAVGAVVVVALLTVALKVIAARAPAEG
jgi:magnesium-transporting ATPase (P-type)